MRKIQRCNAWKWRVKKVDKQNMRMVVCVWAEKEEERTFIKGEEKIFF
jgi:hypothetical protein